MNILIGALICLIFLISCALLFFIFQEINKQKIYSKPSQKNYNNKIVNSQVNNDLENKLLVMIGGDRKVARRLIRHLRYKNPGQKESWYWEKAIYDLERDCNYR